MQEEIEISYEKQFEGACRKGLGQSFDGRSGIVYITKQLNIPLEVLDSMPFFENYFIYYIKCDSFLSELDGFFVHWLIQQKLYVGNQSPLFNEQVIKDIYDTNPHLYEDDVNGIKMTGTQRDNKRRCIIRFCSQKFSTFLRYVYGRENYETIIFAQKGDKKRIAERQHETAKQVKSEQRKRPSQILNNIENDQQETEFTNTVIIKTENSVGNAPSQILNNIEIEQQETESTNTEIIETEDSVGNAYEEFDEVISLYQNVNNVEYRSMLQMANKIETEDEDDDIESENEDDDTGVETDDVIRLYQNKKNVSYRNMLQQIHRVMVANKPKSSLHHKIKDTKGTIDFLKENK